MKNKRIKLIVLATLIILLIPLIAMQFTSEVNWSPIDFVVAGVLLLGTGLICDLAIRKVKKIKYQTAIIVVILITLLLVWAELAVGIFGTPISGS